MDSPLFFKQRDTTTFVLANLHCSSCVYQVERVLASLHPRPTFSCSIVDGTVTVVHATWIPADHIADILDNAGFEVYTDNSNHRTSLRDTVDQAVHRWRILSPYHESRKRKRHLQTCELCRTKSKETRISQQPLSIDATEKTTLSITGDSNGAESEKDTNAAPLVSIGSANAHPDAFKATVTIGGMTCSSCTGSITRALDAEAWVQMVNVNLLTNSAVVVFRDVQNKDKIVDTIEDIGFEASLEEVAPLQPQSSAIPDIWKATYTIGGMTCSSCVTSLNTALKQPPWIRDISVNLLTNSAEVTFESKAHAQNVIEIIEDVGFEAQLYSIGSVRRDKDECVTRVARIRVEGMFCPQCPKRILDSLAPVQGVTVQKPPTIDSPIVEVSYHPAPPGFTIRDIIDTIAEADPAFQVSIHKQPSLEERQHSMHMQQRRYMSYRVCLSVLAAIPTFIIGIIYMEVVPSSNKSRQYLMEQKAGILRGDWAMFVLATLVYFFAADVFHRRALKEFYALWRPGSPTPLLRRFYRFGSMNTLVFLGTSIAYWSSIAELCISGSSRSPQMSDSKSNPYYFDSVVFLTLFLLIGRLIEAYAKSKAGDAISALANLRPSTVLLVAKTEQNNDSGQSSVREIPVELVEVGDVVRIIHGASPAFDGTVLSGESRFDESSLTGESKLIAKHPDSKVFAGTVNKGDAVSIKITGGAGNSMLDQIMSVVREGQTKRAPVERVADLLTGIFVPVITLLAILTWIIWLALGLSGTLPEQDLDGGVGGWPFWSLQFAIAVFVVACPCGLGLAAPTALFVGGGLAAKQGILVKGGGEAFQEASQLDIVAFDKTGTLTQGGQPKVTDHNFGADTFEADVVYAIVRQLENDSSHPIAKALVDFSSRFENVRVDIKAMATQEVPGKGITGKFKVREHMIEALLGNESLMADFDVSIDPDQRAQFKDWQREGKSVALLATKMAQTTIPDSESSAIPADMNSWSVTALFAISDPLRPEAAIVIRALQARNIAVWMVSGDNPSTAHAIGAQVGIPASNIIAGVLPTEKAEKVKYLQRSQSKRRSHTSSLFQRLFPRLASRHHRDPLAKRANVAYIGDGINDAPALTQSDVSIAIGSGSDVALASASFVLLTSDLRALLTLLDLSRTVFRRVLFNFAWALMYNVCLVPVAAGCLFAVRGSGGGHVRLDPAWAALAMAASSVSVVVSSLALRWSWLPGVGFRDRSGLRAGSSGELSVAESSVVKRTRVENAEGEKHVDTTAGAQ